MKPYSVLYAEDVPNYCTAEIEAENDQDVLNKAKTHANTGDLEFNDPDWSNPILRRIVHILDGNSVAVAQDISLDGHHLLTDSKVRDAVRYALECLGSFKADWLTNHGLNVAVEKLEAAYAELGGAA
jgi:hypothetical protein